MSASATPNPDPAMLRLLQQLGHPSQVFLRLKKTREKENDPLSSGKPRGRSGSLMSLASGSSKGCQESSSCQGSGETRSFLTPVPSSEVFRVLQKNSEVVRPQ